MDKTKSFVSIVKLISEVFEIGSFFNCPRSSNFLITEVLAESLFTVTQV